MSGQYLSIPYNNPVAYGLLNASVAAGTTSVTLQSGQGANFPSIPTNWQMRGTFTDTGEVAYVTAISGDVLTLVRGQETLYGAPAAASHNSGTRFEIRFTAGYLAEAQVGAGWYLDLTTWTYASATTFTIASDYSNIMLPGTRLTLVQSGSTKYFSVVSSSYSNPTTTVTITGGTDYTLANAAISTTAYSYAEALAGFPDYFNYAPTYSASGSMTFTSVTTELARFKLFSKTCHLTLSGLGTTGGSADTKLIASLPVTSVSSVSNSFGANVSDTVPYAGVGVLNDTTHIAVLRYDNANFGLGANRRMAANGIYYYA
jgi:hypothetical protein